MAANHPKQSRFSISIPWWASVLMAAVWYALLKYFIPTLQSTNPRVQGLIDASPTFAPLVAIPFLLLAAKQLYDVAPGHQDAIEDTDKNETDE